MIRVVYLLLEGVIWVSLAAPILAGFVEHFFMTDSREAHKRGEVLKRMI